MACTDKPFGRWELFMSRAPWSIFPRKRLDISFRDLISAGRDCQTSDEDHYSSKWQRRRRNVETALERKWGSSQYHTMAGKSERETLVCFSVRTGFDLFLQTLSLPAGSEILFSGVTIPDMVRIAEAHQLKVVPLDLDLETLTVSAKQLEESLNERTRVFVFAHLFGARVDVSPLIEITSRENILFFEDCAECYQGLSYRGHPDADVSIFSFGSIKTATSLGGALALVKSPALLERMRMIERGYPIQTHREFKTRVLRFAALHGLATPPLYGLFVRGCRVAGKSHEEIITSSVRGFTPPSTGSGASSTPRARARLLELYRTRSASSGGGGEDRTSSTEKCDLETGFDVTQSASVSQPDASHSSAGGVTCTEEMKNAKEPEILQLIRKRPCTPLLQLLLNRLNAFDEEYLRRRRRACEYVAKKLACFPTVQVPGRNVLMHTYWLFPVMVKNPDTVSSKMLSKGFDVTRGATQLGPVERYISESKPSQGKMERFMDSIIYLPITPEVPQWALDAMVEELMNATRGQMLESKPALQSKL